MQPGSRGWLHAGRVGRAHGLDGSFVVRLANARLLVAGATVLVDGHVHVVVRRAGQDARPIIRFEDCVTRAHAEALRGCDLLVERHDAPVLGDDEWWAEDLEGLQVRDGARTVGSVRQLLTLPSCEVLEVQRTEGGPPLLVPLVSDAVRTVDLERRYVDVDLGFLGER